MSERVTGIDVQVRLGKFDAQQIRRRVWIITEHSSQDVPARCEHNLGNLVQGSQRIVDDPRLLQLHYTCRSTSYAGADARDPFFPLLIRVLFKTLLTEEVVTRPSVSPIHQITAKRRAYLMARQLVLN